MSRILKLLVALVAAAPLAFLYSLPGKMIEEFIISSLNDAVITLTGLNQLNASRISEALWLAAPFSAAIATLYLYSILQNVFCQRPSFEIREADTRSILQKSISGLFTVAAVAVLALFITSVGYAGYMKAYAPVVVMPSRFSDIQRLNNYALRERAFTIADKLDSVLLEYDNRQHEINDSYNRDVDEKYNREEAEFKEATVKYNACINPPIQQTTTPLLVMPNSQLWNNCGSAPSEPERPRPPPSVPVDADWAMRAMHLQEEADAVWEVINHRLGTYVVFFKIPKSYNASEEIAVTMKDVPAALRAKANELH